MNQQPFDGQVELVRREPDPKPAWTIDPSLESDQKYLAFKGRSRDTAHPSDAERLAFQDSRVNIGNYLFTHVNT